MLRPVGPERPAVYWRRRVVLLASVVLVVVLLTAVVRGVASRSGAAPAAAPTTSSAPVTSATPAISARARATTTARPAPRSTQPHLPEFAKTSAAPATATSSGAAASGSPTTGAAASSSAPPQPCAARDLRISARPEADHFAVGSEPTLGLQVTDIGPAPCVQDLADKQVLLRVYNGEARVWSSHDCGVQPGTDLRTLQVGRPVRVAMQWSGRTSQPGCGNRQPVGAGSYTLYASVAGHDGTAATFTLS